MEKHGTLTSYIWGFALSIALTLGAYFLTLAHVNSAHEALPHEVLIPIILVLAVVQLAIQLVSFLHFGAEKGPRWQSAAFIITLGIVLTIVVSSIWIMSNLNANMTPDQINLYMQDQGSF